MAVGETREMYGEIAGLIGALAKALALEEDAVIAAVERGALALDFGADDNGNRYVAATYQGRTARVYQGAIRHPPER
jgi:hypothetical protein